MLDINIIKDDPQRVKDTIKNKQLEGTVDIDELLKVDIARRQAIQLVEEKRAEINNLSSKISTLKDEERLKLINEAKEIKSDLKQDEEVLKGLEEKYLNLMQWVPNIPADDVPIGKDESGNIVIKTVIDQKPSFDFEPKEHYEIGKDLGIIDTERGVKISGFRGYFLVGKGMLLEQAILKYALDFMVDKGFTPMSVPVMVNKEALFGTGYLPWGEEDHYVTQDDGILVGTSEVSLTSFHAGEILDVKDFPVLLTGLSPCFRREIGTYGKDTAGVVRVHQFNKVEQVVLLPADEELSREWHDKLLNYAETILNNLGLAYQVLLMCTGDMGAGQRKKYDIETWFPGQNKFRETHSDSYFNDFQTRRLNIRYKDNNEFKYAYSMNNTVAATPRLLAAILENNQQSDGSVVVPEVLRKYTGFDKIEKK